MSSSTENIKNTQNTEKNEGKNSFDFSFSNQIKESNEVQSYLQKHEYDIRRNIEKKPSSNSTYQVWALVFMLMASLISLSVYSIVLIQGQQKQIAALQQEKNAQVAGVKEDLSAKNIISADGFSLVLSAKSPVGFELKRESKNSAFLPGKQAVTTSYQLAKFVDGKEFISGIQIEVMPYDNQLSSEIFADKVTQAISADAKKTSENLSIPKGISLTKISTQNLTKHYYTGVTADNYYVVVLTSQTKDLPEMEEVNNFTNSFLQNLYLN